MSNSNQTGQESAHADAEILTLEAADFDSVRPPPAILKECCALFEFTTQETRVANTGSFELTAMASPVDAGGKVVRKGRARYRLTMPVTRKTGTKAGTRPDTFWQAYCLVLALDKNAPRQARKIGPGRFELPNGEVVNSEKATVFNKAVEKTVLETIVKLYNTKNALVGKRVYAFVKHEIDEKNRIWPQLIGVRMDPPESATVEKKDFVMDAGDVSHEVDEKLAF